MDVANINTQTAASPPAASSTGTTGAASGTQNSMGENDFLQLLVAQMKNQDPMNPLNSTQFASQLAQFNSVEQLINLNSGVQTLSNSQNSMSTALTNTLAASIAGKSVKAISDAIYHNTGKSTDINYELSGPASDVNITIQDANGNTVRSVNLSNMGSGDNTWTWDGKDNSGHSVPEGQYKVVIKASNGSSSVQVNPFIEGTADKVIYSGNGVELEVNNVDVNLGNVLEIGE